MRFTPEKTAHGVLETLSAGLCDRFQSHRGDARTLLIAHPSLRVPRWPGRGGNGNPFGLELRLTTGTGRGGDVPEALLRCASAELPFLDGVFSCVTLYHVIAEGGEAELEEACRVLAPGGHLLVVGLNHCGWVGFDAGAWNGVPRLHALRVRHRLSDLGMVVEGQFGAGLLGRNRPAVIADGWKRLALPLADIVLLHARHLHRPIASRPRLKNLPAGLAPTALAGR